ncbi:armadillo-type protein [Mycena latifolia]|nr:armadillo-type protein [Mycena latifolia]
MPPDVAIALKEAKVPHRVVELLECTIPSVRKDACEVLGNLARNRSSELAVLATNPCARLVALLSDTYVSEAALSALNSIVDCPAGAEDAVAAKVVEHAADSLVSEFDRVRLSASKLLGRLAKHEGTAQDVVDIAPCKQLVTLLNDSDRLIADTAFDTLSTIANSPDGANAALSANVLQHTTDRLLSPVPQVPSSACELLVKLARHESTADAAWDTKLCERLVALLGDNDVAAEAFYVLSTVANVRGRRGGKGSGPARRKACITPPRHTAIGAGATAQAPRTGVHCSSRPGYSRASDSWPF